MIVVNQRIFVDEHRSSRRVPAFVMPSTRLLASIFDTLLSSQGSDAHLRSAPCGRLPLGATSLAYPIFVPVPNRRAVQPVIVVWEACCLPRSAACSEVRLYTLVGVDGKSVRTVMPT